MNEKANCNLSLIVSETNQMLCAVVLKDEPNGSVTRIPIMNVVLGSGIVVWSDFTARELTDEEYDSIIEKAKSFPARIPLKMVAQLKELIRLNQQRRDLADELSKKLDDMYDLGLDSNYENPLYDLSESDIVAGEVVENTGKTPYLKVEGHRPAGQNGYPGYYCFQEAGYLEDDFSGQQYIALFGSEEKYLKIGFSF